jgi:hypothetical protein
MGVLEVNLTYGDNLTIINATDSTVEAFPKVTFPAFTARNISLRKSKKLLLLNQVNLQDYLDSSTVILIYESNKGLCAMPISIPTYLDEYTVFFQVINVSKIKGRVDIRARFGDHLQLLKYQQKTGVYRLSANMELVIDYYRENSLWQTIKGIETKQGSVLLHVITDQKDWPVLPIQLNY